MSQIWNNSQYRQIKHRHNNQSQVDSFLQWRRHQQTTIISTRRINRREVVTPKSINACYWNSHTWSQPTEGSSLHKKSHNLKNTQKNQKTSNVWFKYQQLKPIGRGKIWDRQILTQRPRANTNRNRLSNKYKLHEPGLTNTSIVRTTWPGKITTIRTWKWEPITKRNRNTWYKSKTRHTGHMRDRRIHSHPNLTQYNHSHVSQFQHEGNSLQLKTNTNSKSNPNPALFLESSALNSYEKQGRRVWCERPQPSKMNQYTTQSMKQNYNDGVLWRGLRQAQKQRGASCTPTTHATPTPRTHAHKATSNQHIRCTIFCSNYINVLAYYINVPCIHITLTHLVSHYLNVLAKHYLVVQCITLITYLLLVVPYITLPCCAVHCITTWFVHPSMIPWY